MRSGSRYEGGETLAHIDKYDSLIGLGALGLLLVARLAGVDSGFEQLASAGVGLFWGLSLRGRKA